MTTTDRPYGWRRYIPISVWLTAYERGHLAADLIAALTVWALVVPSAMAYASLAGMPPETGLYSALVAPLAYAVFGTSRQLGVGPSSTVAAETRPRVVLIDAESISDIDSTALDIVRDLRTELRDEGIELWVARLKQSVAEMQERVGGYEELVTFTSVRAAVQAFGALPEPAEDEAV